MAWPDGKKPTQQQTGRLKEHGWKIVMMQSEPLSGHISWTSSGERS